MKGKCKRDDLLAAFQIAASVAPTRSPKPILQNVLLDASPSKCTLMATDMELGVRVEVPGIEVSAPGAVVLPAVRFGSILRESTDETLQLESDGEGILVQGQRSEFRFPAESPEEFPRITAFQEQSYHELPARLMKELVRRTQFATDVESSRYALGGVLLELESNKIIAVGTDGRRLAKMEGETHEVGEHEMAETMTIVPTRSMQFIERSLSDADAEIRLVARPNDLLLQTPRMTVYTRLVEGRFPRWRDVFPNRPNALRMELTVGPVFTALRQAAVVASTETRGLDFIFGSGTLVLSGNTAEVGRSRVELPIPYDGEEIQITLDYRFVADFMKVLASEKTFTLEIENREGAAVFTTDDGYGYVVMPLSRERDR